MSNRIDPKFPKAAPGDGCDGRKIYAPDGRQIGTLTRAFVYRRPSLMSESYVNVVAGYEVEDFDCKVHAFKGLAEATAFARRMPYGPPPSLYTRSAESIASELAKLPSEKRPAARLAIDLACILTGPTSLENAQRLASAAATNPRELAIAMRDAANRYLETK